MEQRTATHESSSANERAARKPSQRPAEDEKGSVIFRSGRRLVRAVASPALNVWEGYLRDPVAKGLITTGAVLTETGRLILNYGRRADGSSEQAPSGKAAAGKRTLH